jgi:hypothetical protein
MDADELVRRYIMRTFREPDAGMYSSARNGHLMACPDTVVSEAEVEGCRFWDTGVTGMQFTAVISCPHGERQEFEFGELGELPDILADLDRDAAGGYSP